MKLENPKVSIVTPLYNSERFIDQAINSVLAQDYKNWEMLIVDDCSSDSSINIVGTYTLIDSRIRLFRLTENSGSGVARNLAIREATGRFIAFLDSDDVWHPNKLSLHVKVMIESGAAFSHTSYGYMYENGTKYKKTFRVSDSWVDYRQLLRRTEISCLTAMYDVTVIGKIYMPNLRRKQDYALWLDILKKGHKSFPLDKVLAWYRQVEGSSTSSKSKLIIKHYQFLRKFQNLSRIESIYFSVFWIINGAIRYYIK